MKISVVLAAYNEEKLIGRCIEAIQNQDFPKNEYEIVVVDNNSKDRTSQIVKKAGITPLLYDAHQGAIWAKDYAVDKAKGEIVVVTDADSIPAKNWLKEIDQIMQDKKIKLAGGKVYPIGNSLTSRLLLETFDIFAAILSIFGVPLVWGSNMVVRKSAFEQVGGFDTTLHSSDDWEFTLRIQKKYGLKSARYMKSMKVKVSPRKFEDTSNFIPYFLNGFFSFISIFIFRRAWRAGAITIVR
jgi:glycosyltransferase involved in cell wall biosynthesis